MAAPQPGDRVNNYILEEQIGQGTFGRVWRARHHVFREPVAIKIPTDAEYVQHLRREGVAIHGLRHPNIVRALDLDPYADPPYLVMEYVPGESLRRFLEVNPQGLPLETCLAVIRGVLRALSVAHEAGVIHRDLKPENILLTKTSAQLADVCEQTVKVADFGLGRIGGAMTSSLMQSGSAGEGGSSGTPAYMAPEQQEGLEADARSDLYSCGIVLFEMLTGKRPQGAEVPSRLRSGVPPALDAVFLRCYARREHRFGSAADMLAALVPSSGRKKAPEGKEGEQTCPSCHGLMRAEDQFCIYCGRQLAAVVPQCSSCGGYVHVLDHFCIFCGQDLRRKVG